MPLIATFRHGDPIMVDYTPAANYAAGETVLVGNTAGLTNGIAHRPLTNAEKGALAAGGGVYLVRAAAAYAIGTKVYADSANNNVTTTTTNMSQFGYMLEASTVANQLVECLHHPRA